MIGTYAPHPDGGFTVETPAGVPLRTVFDEQRLQAMGYEPRPGLTQPGSQALAEADPRYGSSDFEPPATVSDAGPIGSNMTPHSTPAERAKLDTERRAIGERIQAEADAWEKAAFDAAPASRGTPEQRYAAAGPSRVGGEAVATQGGLRGGGDVVDSKKFEGGAQGPSGYSSPRYAMVPAADRRAAFSVEKSGVNPEDWKRFEQGEAGALDERKQAATDEMRRGQIEGGVQSAQMGYDARAEEAAVAARQRQADAMAADYQRRAEAIDKERAAIDALEVKPDKLFGGATWGKAIAAISVLSGGVLAGLKGGKNQALEALNEIADRSAAGKRAEYEKRRQGLAGRESDFGRLVQLYGTPQAAEAELRDRHRLLIQRWAEKRALDSNVAGAPDQLKMQFAQWDQERAAGVIDRQQKLSDHVREAWQNTPAHAVQVGGERPLKPDERERKVELGDGTHGFARSAVQAKEAQDKLTVGSDIIQGLTELRALGQQAGNVNVEPARLSAIKQRMKSIALGLAPRLNVRLGQGAMSKDEVEQRMQAFGNPEAIIRGQSDAAIEETIRTEKRTNHSIARDYLYQDPTGAVPLAQPDAGGMRREN